MRTNIKNIKLSASSKKKLTIAIAGALVLCCAVTGTLMYLVDRTAPVKNTFNPSNVAVGVTENFNGTVKSNVNAKNTGNIDAFIRIKLVTYRVNDDGVRIGGTATIPVFALENGWFEKDGFYYYSNPVAPNEQPTVPLINSITLKSYSDADGGKQVIEVIAEAIQAEGTNGTTPAVTEAWGITVSNGVLQQ